MINATILPNGNLKITAGNESRAWLAEQMAGDRYNFWATLWDAFEDYACNGSFEPFDAGEANPFVGLTSAPCIAESMSIADNGDRTIDGQFWYFDRYQIDCPLEQLRNCGRVIFTLAKEDSE